MEEKRNNGIAERLIEAGKYQKLALRVLLPEHIQGHIEVIENELKAIIKECACDIVKNSMDRDSAESNEKAGGAKKIIIE